MTYNPFRLRIAPDRKVLRKETEPNGGQWWSAQDNYGKTWWVDGGGELGPVNIQAPIAYGAFNVADNFEPDSGHPDYVIRVLLHGLTGPLGDKEYPGGNMIPMGTNTDQWIADITNYVRNSFRNRAVFVTPDQVALARKVTAARKTMWTLPELEASLPRLLSNQGAWRVTASHNANAAQNAIAAEPGVRWDTGGAPQQPGMWFQIELPQATSVTEIQIDTTASTEASAGRQGRGRRGAAATAAPQAPGRTAGQRAGPATGPVASNLQVSMDGKTWSPPVAEGTGSTPTTVIAFPPVQARFIRLTQTGTASATEQWGIGQVRVFEAGK